MKDYNLGERMNDFSNKVINVFKTLTLPAPEQGVEWNLVPLRSTNAFTLPKSISQPARPKSGYVNYRINRSLKPIKASETPVAKPFIQNPKAYNFKTHLSKSKIPSKTRKNYRHMTNLMTPITQPKPLQNIRFYTQPTPEGKFTKIYSLKYQVTKR